MWERQYWRALARLRRKYGEEDDAGQNESNRSPDDGAGPASSARDDEKAQLMG
ncbi:MAG: hypothetical protein Kow0047_08620 [Anaerolineae bacterium]